MIMSQVFVIIPCIRGLLGISWPYVGVILGLSLAYLWHILSKSLASLAYFGKLWHTLAYSFILWHIWSRLVVPDLFWGPWDSNFLFMAENKGGTHNIQPNMCQSMPEMPKICSRYAQDMPKICPRYAQDMPKICQGYPPDMAKICPAIL